ncbi:MAG TPA: PAS domain S-box protein [Polyangiaceae bacterium]|nr:PAS domain S-box protein [Polyangiaceae bacterium]
MASEREILIVDDDNLSRKLLRNALAAAGMNVVALGGGREAIAYLESRIPRALLLDLVMEPPDGYAVLAHVRQSSRLAELPVVVLTGLDSEEEIQRIFASGADDYVHKPFRPTELVLRIKSQLRMREAVERLSQRERDQDIVLGLTQQLASTLDVRAILFTVVERVAKLARVDRCSIVLFADSGQLGYVLATSDDPRLRDLPIDLAKYPEIREVLANGRNLVIRDAERHPLLEVVRRDEPARGFHSLALVPIVHDLGPMGVLFLRARAKAELSDSMLALVSTLANATAIALRNARILENLQRQSEQTAVARDDAERRVRLFQRYADFFESAAEAMLVIDRTGRILFANPRSVEVTGLSHDELLSLDLVRLFDPSEQPRTQLLLQGFTRGQYPRDIDLALRRRREVQRSELVTVSASFSSVLHEQDAIFISLRDVTQERHTAVELVRTKEFLESVIDSSVDGIVSANLRGKVLLFNRAAARIFGYGPDDVVGKLRVDKLYPPGGAREVMQKILNPDLFGYGRLEDYRVDMLAADGSLIPVQLSASLVLDDGRPIGSVGIFTDIREKLRIQSELERAQEELRLREKQAMLAELAGTTAHELNQPLTSVLGYAALLKRKLADTPEHLPLLDVIIEQADRMAKIVKKVGHITHYETKSYVGTTKILDLDKASGLDPEGLPE